MVLPVIQYLNNYSVRVLYSGYQLLFPKAYLNVFRLASHLPGSYCYQSTFTVWYQLLVTWNLFEIGNTSLSTFRDCSENTLLPTPERTMLALMFNVWESAAGCHVAHGRQTSKDDVKYAGAVCCSIAADSLMIHEDCGLSHKHLKASVRKFSKRTLPMVDLAVVWHDIKLPTCWRDGLPKLIFFLYLKSYLGGRKI